MNLCMNVCIIYVCMYVSVTSLRLKYTDFFVLRHLVNVNVVWQRNDGRTTGNLRASCSVISLVNVSNDLERQWAAQHRCEYTKINKGELASNSFPYCALPLLCSHAVAKDQLSCSRMHALRMHVMRVCIPSRDPVIAERALARRTYSCGRGRSRKLGLYVVAKVVSYQDETQM